MIRHRLLQVLVNLLVNARDALSAEGEIRLTGGEVEDSVWLALADNGAGIAEQDLSHIFDPFFTTKAPGKGCGLGLAVCYRVLDEAGGSIEVQSKAGRGSVFTVHMKREDGGHGC
jgi:C4-dicarboxylate-specific signal transduction histidine kinase